MKGRARHKGYTLIELLVVMTIIVIMTSVAVPTMIRSGLFSSDESGTAARELFAQLRAASLRARTANTDAAIAYDVTLVQDSLYEGSPGSNTVRSIVPPEYVATYPEVADPNWNSERPVLTETLFVRRLTIDELKKTDASGVSLAQRIRDDDAFDEYGTYDNLKDDLPFVPANAPVARFEPLPADMALLINHPDIIQTADDPENADRIEFEDRTGLRSIAIFFVIDQDGTTEVVRLKPKVEDAPRGLPDPLNTGDWNNRFPAHVFDKSGALDNLSISGRQRIQLNVGLKPDADYLDRYMVNEDDTIFTFEEFFDAAGDATSPNFENYNLVGIDTEITIFAPTGRVVLEGNNENT